MNNQQTEQKPTIQEKLEKKGRDLSKAKICNICSSPRYVSYREKDEETGREVEKTHIVECNGHFVLPYLWNLSKDFDEYQNFIIRYRERTNKPPKEKK